MTRPSIFNDTRLLPETWPTEPIVQRSAGAADTGVLTQSTLDQLIILGSIPPKYLGVIRNGSVVDRNEFVDGNAIDAGRLNGLRQDGATVTVRAMQEWHEPAEVACGAIESWCQQPVQANAYLTPPESQGFAHHWDTHLAIVLQVEGQKTWQLYRPFIENPVFPQTAFTTVGFTDQQRRDLEREPMLEVTLAAGDVLWVPTGWVHNPFTSGGTHESSLHVTFGVLQERNIDELHRIMAGSVSKPIFRIPLPLGGRQIGVEERASLIRHAIEYLRLELEDGCR